MAHHEQLDQKLNVDPCSHLHHFSKLSFSLIIYSTIKKASNISSSRHPDPKKERVLEEGGQISPARVQASKWGNSPIPFFLESRPFREVFGGFGGGLSCSWLFFSNKMCPTVLLFYLFSKIWFRSVPLHQVPPWHSHCAVWNQRGPAVAVAWQPCGVHKINDVKEVLMWNTVFFMTILHDTYLDLLIAFSTVLKKRVLSYIDIDLSLSQIAMVLKRQAETTNSRLWPKLCQPRDVANLSQCESEQYQKYQKSHATWPLIYG